MREIRAIEVPAPHLVEAEQQLLGALLTNNEVWDKIATRIDSSAFHDPIHSEIFAAIGQLIEDGRRASPVTLRVQFENHDGLKELGGPAYLARLAGAAIGVSTAHEYAEILSDLKAKRDLLESAQDAIERIRRGQDTAGSIAVALETSVGAIGARSSIKPLIRSHLSTLTGAIELINQAYSDDMPPGVSTGLPQLDRKVVSFRPGQYIIVAGRPSMGKTTVAQNFVWAAMQQGKGAFYGSLEMPGEEMANRFLSKGLAERGIHIPYRDMISGNISEKQFRQVIDEAKRQEALPLRVAEREARTLPVLKSAVRRAQQEMAGTSTPLGVVVIDYLQMVHVPNSRSTYDQVSAVSDACKTMAMEYGIPVIALAQLSREVERREPPVPALSDMRESGKLEEDADVVLLCYRDSYYLKRKYSNDLDVSDLNDLQVQIAACEKQIDLIIAKQRNGPTGTVTAFIEEALCHVSPDRPDYDQERMI